MMILDLFLAPFAWQLNESVSTGVWHYYENTINFNRKAQWTGIGYQPVNIDWLARSKGKAYYYNIQTRRYIYIPN